MPTYTDTTETLYALLPEHRRRADDEQGGALDQPLKRYLSGIGDELDDLVVLIDRLAHTEDGLAASDLADPADADAAWLPWLAQLVGVDTETMSVPEMRVAIAATNFRAGTRAGIIEAVAGTLTGTKRVTLHRHVDGDPWQLFVDTWAAETPDPDLTDAVAEGQKPAGVALTRRHLPGLTWRDAALEFDTWGDLVAAFDDWQEAATTMPTWEP